MFKIVKTIAFSLLLMTIVALPAGAETVAEKIKRTGVLTAGVWKSAKPFGYVNDNDEWVGYGMDLINLVKDRLEKGLKQPIKLELVEVNAQNRFDLIMKGKVDLECGPTTFTWEREKFVDFSISTFLTGTQFLAKKDLEIKDRASFKGKRLGVQTNTTTERIGALLGIEPEFVKVNSDVEGWEKLQKGEIDIYASDGILLQALRRSASDPEDWQLFPEQPVTHESYACMVPENNSGWRDFVNYSLMRAIQGYLIGDPEFTKMYQFWFGPEGVTPYSQELLKAHFQGLVNSLQGIPRNAY